MFLMIGCGGGGEFAGGRGNDFLGGLRQKMKAHENVVNKKSRTILDTNLSEFVNKYSKGARMFYVEPMGYSTDRITKESKGYFLADFEGYALHMRHLKEKDPELPFLQKSETYIILKFKGNRIGVLREVRLGDVGGETAAANPKKGEIDVLIPYSNPFDMEAGPWKLKGLGHLVCRLVKKNEAASAEEIARNYIEKEIKGSKEMVEMQKEDEFWKGQYEKKLIKFETLEKNLKIEDNFRAANDNKKEKKKLGLIAEQNKELDAQTYGIVETYPMLNHIRTGEAGERVKLEDVEKFIGEHNLEVKFNNSRAVVDKALMNLAKMQDIPPNQKSQMIFAVYHYFFYTTVSDYLHKNIKRETNGLLMKAGISQELRKSIWDEIRKIKNPEEKTAAASIHFSTTRKLVVPAKDIEEGQEEIFRTTASMVMAHLAGAGCLNDVPGEKYPETVAILMVAISGYFRATNSIDMDEVSHSRFEWLFTSDLLRNGINQNIIDETAAKIREIELAKKNSRLEIV